jgi:hypothetical protein
MNSSVIRAALFGLEGQLEQARQARTQIEYEALLAVPSPGGGYEDPKAALSATLTELYEVLLVVLEAAGLSETRSHLLARWDHLEVKKTTYNYQFDYAENKAYEHLSHLLEGLRNISADDRPHAESYELVQLETILRRTPVLLRRRNIVPRGEEDIQEVMHDYLSAFFTEYKHPIRIHGIIKNFDPDGGIRNLQTAIEFKYAATHEEVSRALSGVFEDVSGYQGSKDWTRFYTLIYQTEAFESEDRVRSELKRASAMTWRGILVTGSGYRGKRQKRGTMAGASRRKKP